MLLRDTLTRVLEVVDVDDIVADNAACDARLVDAGSTGSSSTAAQTAADTQADHVDIKVPDQTSSLAALLELLDAAVPASTSRADAYADVVRAERRR